MNAHHANLIAFARTKRCRRTGTVITTRVELLRDAMPVEHIELRYEPREPQRRTRAR